jgi:hypothetical protein
MRSANNPFYGFKGLNISVEGFAKHVMSPAEVRLLFDERAQYEAPFVYPAIVANMFEKPTIFSAEAVTKDNFILRADITINQRPATFAGKIAGLFLPKHFVQRELIQFFEDEKAGFNLGSFRITSQSSTNDDGTPARRSTAVTKVTNRPGLFLKIARQDGGFHKNAAIFFPAQISTTAHAAVKLGEAFVLIKKGDAVNEELLSDIKTTFSKLVAKSYGQDNGLYTIGNNKPLEAAAVNNNKP